MLYCPVDGQIVAILFLVTMRSSRMPIHFQNGAGRIEWVQLQVLVPSAQAHSAAANQA